MNLMKHYPFPSGFPLLQKQGHFSIKKTPFAKGELGTHIDRYRSLIMPLRFVRQAVANNTAQSLVLHTQGFTRVKNKRTCACVIR